MAFSPADICLILLAQCLAYTVKCLIGFGNPLISAPLLSMRLDNVILTPGTLIMDCPINGYITWKNRRSFDWRRVLPLLLANMCGVVPGTLKSEYHLRYRGTEPFCSMLVDLAEHQDDGYIPMKDIARRQEVSKKYLEQIMPALTKAGLVEAVHGVGGGYRLTRSPEEYRIGEILRLTEGDLAPVACLSHQATPCSRAAECRTLSLWKGLDKVISDYLDKYTLADLMHTDPDGYDYVI